MQMYGDGYAEEAGASLQCSHWHVYTYNLGSLQYIEVVPGQEKPLMRPAPLCPEIHGDSGLDGPG